MLNFFPSYRSPGLRTINGQVRSLPSCPVCGGLTSLDEIVIQAAEGPRGWAAFVLRCVESVDPFGLRKQRNPDWKPCGFVIPMTPQAVVPQEDLDDWPDI